MDTPGVGWLVRLAAWVGREQKPDLKLGICGEHGGDPNSIAFFHMAGLDYVSCSPFRIPIARVATAQIAIRERCEWEMREVDLVFDAPREGASATGPRPAAASHI